MNDPKAVRRALWTINKKCYWCAKDTVWFDGPGEVPWNVATLDHVYRISDPRRTVVPGSVLLSCRSCNTSRGISDNENAAKKLPPFTERTISEIMEEQPSLIPIPLAGKRSKQFIARILFGLFTLKVLSRDL